MTHFMIPCKDLYIILTETQVLPDIFKEVKVLQLFLFSWIRVKFFFNRLNKENNKIFYYNFLSLSLSFLNIVNKWRSFKTFLECLKCFFFPGWTSGRAAALEWRIPFHLKLYSYRSWGSCAKCRKRDMLYKTNFKKYREEYKRCDKWVIKKREASGRYWLVRGNESKRTNSARARSAL